MKIFAVYGEGKKSEHNHHGVIGDMESVLRRKNDFHEGRGRPPLKILAVILSLFVFPPSWVFAQDLPSLREGVQGNKLETWKRDNKVEHSTLITSTLLLMAEENVRKGNMLAALSYAEKAAHISPASPLPHFFLSSAIPLTSQEALVRSAREYITALKLSFHDFWLLSASLGITVIALFLAIFLGLLTFLLYGFVAYLPQWIHYVQERLTNRLHPNLIGIVLLLILGWLFYILPLFWFLLFNLFLFWFFYHKAEKQIALLFLGGFILSFLFLRPAFLGVTLTQFPLLNQMVKNQQREFILFPGVAASEEHDWRALFVEGSYRVQKRDWKEAERLYQEALLKNPDSVLILNNLGNVSFYQNRLDQALTYYQRAVDLAPGDTLAHYNMSQVYREQLLFQKGEEKYHQTKEMNPDQINDYTRLATAYPNYPVMEGRFSRKDLWEMAFEVGRTFDDWDALFLERPWIGGLSWSRFVVLALFASLGAIGLCLYLSPSVSGGFCSLCFKATCGRCQKMFSTYTMCTDCGKNLKTAISKKKGTFPKRLYPFFILPGGGGLILHKPMRAFFTMLFFYFLAALILWGDLFFSSAHWHLSLSQSPLLFTAVCLLYFFSISDLFYDRISHGA